MEPLLTPQQAADILAIPVKAIHDLCRKRKLAYVQVNAKGERRFLPEHLREFVETQIVPANKPVDKSRSSRLPSPLKKGGKKSVEDCGTDLVKEIRSLCQ